MGEVTGSYKQTTVMRYNPDLTDLRQGLPDVQKRIGALNSMMPSKKTVFIRSDDM